MHRESSIHGGADDVLTSEDGIDIWRMKCTLVGRGCRDFLHMGWSMKCR